MESFNYKELLNYHRRSHMSFSAFVDRFIEDPDSHLYTASKLISEAIKYFGYDIVIRCGEPIFSYHIFRDIFANHVNAVYGQEMCIKKIVDVIDSLGKESGPNRGIVLMGPPASGKTAIVDLMTYALEEYSKVKDVKLYSFYYRFVDLEDPNNVVEIRSHFKHNPILFFTTILQKESGITRPRKELFDYLQETKGRDILLHIPSYYQNASMDKRNLDIIENLLTNPRNQVKSLFDILDEYVRVEEIEFTNAQGVGICNIDDLKKLSVSVKPMDAREKALKILNQHLPTKMLYQYQGALVDSNRGILHVHDAFTSVEHEAEYKPLLMLLGSGKASLESTQVSVDTVTVITTNLEDMEKLEKQLAMSKLLDRIERVPVNYLMDVNSEMDILKRDMSMIKTRYDIDPNLFRMAACFSVMTRLMPPERKEFPSSWNHAKKALFQKITPEQKLFLYAWQNEDPLSVIQRLPYWHPFRNEAMKIGLDLSDFEKLQQIIARPNYNARLDLSILFNRQELELIDDEFLRLLVHEHNFVEGKHGISIRQLQNLMRNTINNSDGRKVHVRSFFNELHRVLEEGGTLHHWLKLVPDPRKEKKPIPSRAIGAVTLKDGEGDFGDYKGLVTVLETIYYEIIRRELIAATVNRDPENIENDLRKYVQYALLAEAIQNKAFAHIMIPRFAFIDPKSGKKIDQPDFHFMESIENIIAPNKDYSAFRRSTAQKFFDLQSEGKIELKEDKPVIYSRDDHFLQWFDREFNLMMTNRQIKFDVDGDQVTKAFFLRRSDPDSYLKLDGEIRRVTEAILKNMSTRFRYSEGLALETVLFALQRKIINFKELIN